MLDRAALLHIPDLMFSARVADTLKPLGLTTRDLRPREPLEPQISGAVLLVLQLAGSLEAWSALIAAAKAAGVPVLAFGAHVEAATLRAARQAGADLAVPNSQLAAELPALVSSLLNL
ncbi:MAG: hypothetical protein HZB53_00680 [Chloroflexi bacterium]|nr:hypothetical protein [Chloroflexota bacterium]